MKPAESFEPFLMERMMSKFEQTVDYNLSESGVHPMLLSELLRDDNDIADLLSTEINYPHVNGIPALRERISRLYNGATPENVLVTVGAIEANYISVQTLLSGGDEIALMLPNYMQIWGIARNLGLDLKTFRLREAESWSPDLDELEEAVTADTRLIAVCNPNNPTGYVLTRKEMSRIVSIADSVGAWILADEVYSGAERLTDSRTPSFFGEYDRVIAVGSMSKAYGLPGLRIGWAVAPADLIEEIWARHEYVAISATMLSNRLAAIALSEKKMPEILQRTRRFVRNGFPVLEKWMREQTGLFGFSPPHAAAIAFVRYDLGMNSTELADRLRTEKSVLIVPGDHFGMDNFIRISFGLPEEYLNAALDRICELIVGIDEKTRAGATGPTQR